MLTTPAQSGNPRMLILNKTVAWCPCQHTTAVQFTSKRGDDSTPKHEMHPTVATCANPLGPVDMTSPNGNPRHYGQESLLHLSLWESRGMLGINLFSHHVMLDQALYMWSPD